MIKFDTTFFFYKLPPILYAIGIFSISAIPNAAPPSLGVAWEDKIYHGIEYFLFSLLVFRAFPRLLAHPRKQRVLVLLFSLGLLFAALDETLQYFVPNRNCSFTDWLSDATGFVVGGYLSLRFRTKAKN